MVQNSRYSYPPASYFRNRQGKIKLEISNDVATSNNVDMLPHAIAKFLMYLKNNEVIDFYKVSYNIFCNRMHISYKWIGGKDDITFSLSQKNKNHQKKEMECAESMA